MHAVLAELLDLLCLERIEQNLFRGQSRSFGNGRVFGGQVLGQALSAAQSTVPEGRLVHSLHAYFLRPGRGSDPIVYNVDPIRDGRSFTTRRVVAIQHGEAIFSMGASFQVDEGGFDHQDAMPDVPGPDGLPNTADLARAAVDRIPEPLRDQMTREWPIEARPVDVYDPMNPSARPPTRRVWFRALDPLPDDPLIHRALLAYASDSHFLTTSLQPHAASWMTPGVQVASIDHAMYFHRPFRMDQWLLYDVHSSTASGARGLVTGKFFDEQGRLVATAVQEGLIRDRR